MWYVIQVPTGEEENVILLCTQVMDRKCYERMFIPRYVAKRKYHGEWHDEVRKLFPGYVFVITDRIKDVVIELHNVRRMTKVLGSDREPVALAEDEKTYLTKMMNDRDVVKMSKGVIIGDKVVITEGVLKDYEGNIRKINRHKREAELEVMLFGRATPVKVGLEVIAKYPDGYMMKQSL